MRCSHLTPGSVSSCVERHRACEAVGVVGELVVRLETRQTGRCAKQVADVTPLLVRSRQFGEIALHRARRVDVALATSCMIPLVRPTTFVSDARSIVCARRASGSAPNRGGPRHTARSLDRAFRRGDGARERAVAQRAVQDLPNGITNRRVAGGMAARANACSDCALDALAVWHPTTNAVSRNSNRG